MKKKLCPICLILLSSLLFSACTTTITNLTPSTQKRNPNGLYPFEVVLDTREQTIRHESLTPYVQVGTQLYAMQPTLMLKNRWETVIPIPANKEYVSYRFKFDYNYRSIPKTRPQSILSAPFQLEIIDK